MSAPRHDNDKVPLKFSLQRWSFSLPAFTCRNPNNIFWLYRWKKILFPLLSIYIQQISY